MDAALHRQLCVIIRYHPFLPKYPHMHYPYSEILGPTHLNHTLRYGFSFDTGHIVDVVCLRLYLFETLSPPSSIRNLD
jgi:hypothetical protein